MQRVQKFQSKLLKLISHKQKIFKILSIVSGLYLVFNLFEIQILIGFIIFFASIYGMLYIRWKAIREKGIINMVNPQIRQVLLKRSIFDIYRDQVYYPYVTKIIATFIKGAISKPHPEELNEMFEDFPQSFQNTINTKGLLKLAPQKVQQLVLTKERVIGKQREKIQKQQKQPIKKQKQQRQLIIHQIVPKNYGKVDHQWDKLMQYEAQQQKIHEHTLQKQVLLKLNEKIHWKHIIPLLSIVSAGILKIKKQKFGKILLYQGSTFGIFILIILIVIKYKKPHVKNKLAKGKRNQQILHQ